MSEEKRPKKESKTFRLSQEAVTALEQIAKDNHMTQTELVEHLILSYSPELDRGADNAAELTLRKLEAEYGEALDKMKTSIKLTDMNVQVALDMLNSLVTGLGITTFSSVAAAPSIVYQGSKDEMKKRISYQKQKVDWRK